MDIFFDNRRQLHKSALEMLLILLSGCFPIVMTVANDIDSPLMCTVSKSKSSSPNCEDNPPWSSCGSSKSCLTTVPGSCSQIRVDVRRVGRTLSLNECDPAAFDSKYCNGDDPKLPGYKCPKECTTLHGIFNCTPSKVEGEGPTCKNMTSLLSCNFTTTDPPISCNSRKACLNLQGLHECLNGTCAKVRSPYKCERSCTEIKTLDKEIMIRQGGGVIHTAMCARVVVMEMELEIWPRSLKATGNPDRAPMLLMSCSGLIPGDNTTYVAVDCFNATLLEPDHFGGVTNYSYILESHYHAERMLDTERLPPETDLQLYNRSMPLYAADEKYNASTCLSQEKCEEFMANYGGGDGGDPWGTNTFGIRMFRCLHLPSNDSSIVEMTPFPFPIPSIE